MNHPKLTLKSILIAILSLLLGWQILSLMANSPAVPLPFDVFISMGSGILSGELVQHFFASFFRLLISIFFALLIGAFLGGTAALYKGWDRVLTPILYVLFPIPKVALLPVLFVFLGLGELTRLVLIFLIVVFQLAITTRDAIKGIPEEMFLSARALNLNRGQLYYHVILPATAKPILSGLRISIGIGTAVLFFAETYATRTGLGYYIMNCWSLIDYKGMYSGILCLSLLGALMFLILDWIEDRFCPWKL